MTDNFDPRTPGSHTSRARHARHASASQDGIPQRADWRPAQETESQSASRDTRAARAAQSDQSDWLPLDARIEGAPSAEGAPHEAQDAWTPSATQDAQNPWSAQPTRPANPSGHNGEWNPYAAQPLGNDDLVRVRKKRKRRRKAPFVALGIILTIIVAVGIAGFNLYSSARGLQSQASAAMSDISAIQDAITANDYDSAATGAKQLTSRAGAIGEELSSPLWEAAALVPVFGEDIASVKTMVNALASVSSDALEPLTAALQAAPPSALVSADGAIDVAALQTLLDAVESAAPAMQACADTIDALPDMHISQLQPTVQSAKEKVSSANDLFQQASTFAPILGTLLGANGDRTYLITAQNTAEIRAAGGLPGSIGTLQISNGEISLGDFSSVHDVMDRALPSSVQITDTEYQLFGSNMDVTYDTGFDPDFTRVASIWAVAYNEKNGTDVDGVVSITPSVVQDVLSVAGSITLSDDTTLDGTNATKVLEHDLYWKYLSGTYQSGAGDLVDALFAEAAQLSFDKLLSSLNSSTFMDLVGILAESADDREVMVWLVDEGEQAQIAGLDCSGAIASSSTEPQLGVFFSMDIMAASKLGWFLDIETTVGDGVRHADGTTTYQVSTTFRNTATLEEAATGGDYIMGWHTDNADMEPFIHIYAPTGGSIDDFSASDGSTFSTAEHEGREVYYIKSTSLAAGETITCTYTVTTAADAESGLDVVATPTLTEYR